MDEKEVVGEKNIEAKKIEINDENYFKKEKDKGRPKKIIQNSEETKPMEILSLRLRRKLKWLEMIIIMIIKGM
jgi:hypothetical protein